MQNQSLEAESTQRNLPQIISDTKATTIDISRIRKYELYKCETDPKYFINNYVKIVDSKGLEILFKLREYQNESIDTFVQEQFTIILKGRQLGLSETVAAYVLWMLNFVPNQNIIVLGNVSGTANEMQRRVQFGYERLPKWLKKQEKKINTSYIELDNGSRFTSISTTPTAGRSAACNLFIIDEAAFLPWADEIWTAAYPTVTEIKGKVIMLSTPNGIGNLFHKTYTKAEEGKNQFKPLKYPWYVHPDRDQAWRDNVEANENDPLKAAQENDCDFITSGRTFIAGKLLDDIEKATVVDPIAREGFDSGIWIYKYPQKNARYVLGADVARGDGGDYSAAHIIDIDTMEQVWEYHGKIDTIQYADLLLMAGYMYNTALIGVENNSIGWSILDRLLERSYANLYYTVGDSYERKHQELVSGKDLYKQEKRVAGFTTSEKSRRIMLTQMRQTIVDGQIKINSKRLINELKVFIWNGKKPEAAKGYNDDLVMSFGIANYLVDFAFYDFEEKNAQVAGNLSALQIVYNESNIRVPTKIETGVDYSNQAEIDWMRKQQDFRKYRR